MSRGDVVLRFDKVSFEYGHTAPILHEVDFSVRRGSKTTFMGQNGAGKSTIFKLIEKGLHPESGKINRGDGLTIASAKQVMSREHMHLTIREFFEKSFKDTVYDIDQKIDAVLEIVNLHAPHERIIQSFSGGQQARLLLASALIQDPDLLLLDEPTNNLDKAGITYLTQFLIDYKKTCIVISHDAHFLNAFTDGVLYLDVFTRTIEQYVGNYFNVIKQITARVEKENKKNAQLAKQAQEKKEKANFFANKGGQMRILAKRMREKAEELEEEQVDVRKEDKTIRPFRIPAQADLMGEIIHIHEFNTIRATPSKTKESGKNKKQKGNIVTTHTANISLKKNMHLLLRGPNGIGKSTLLEAIAKGKAKGSVIAPGIVVGYYRQDFSTLNFEDTVYNSLFAVMEEQEEERMRAVAAGFLITGGMVYTKIGNLSEGQKGLVALARLVLQKPGLLILDEPTNHINFRHIPRIAEALDAYAGAMILVSHVPEFVAKIRIDEVLDLDK